MLKKNKTKFIELLEKVFSVLVLLGISLGIFSSLLTYNSFDPSPFTATDSAPLNVMGKFGASLSAILFFIFGDACWLIVLLSIMLTRVILIKKVSSLDILFRFLLALPVIFMISLSLLLINLESGPLGKVVLSKVMKVMIDFNNFQTLILFANVSIFLIALFLLQAKSYKTFFRSLLRTCILFKNVIIFIFKVFFKTSKSFPKEKQTKIYYNKKNTSLKFFLPSINFLDNSIKPKKRLSENIAIKSKDLEKVLEDYGINGEIISVKEGPVVTRYELEPAPGTRSSRVVSLSDDIARSMSAQSARVSVVFGKNAIGIELPNKNVETVTLKDILSSNLFLENKGLVMALGKNIAGKPFVADLSKMPHILVAGTTGSGKSVSINAMILSLLYKFTPDTCKFILIDPKMLELSVYESIPHLLHPVVTEPRKAIYALKWAVREMNERYKQMSMLGVRNIDSYNSLISKQKYKDDKFVKKVQVGFDNTSGKPIYQNKEIELNNIPFIVIVVDEMADLMLAAGKEIELSIQSLAQKARAAGIHLVLATQRPSVDVITGTIKANLPYRISFQVTSKIDSRTILGEQGAEQLLGKGDMLFMAGGGYTERIHGPFVSDQEVLRVTNFWKSQGKPEYLHHITENRDDEIDNSQFQGEELDPLYQKALDLILKEKKVSTSFLQRHFAIGYNRAARMVDNFEKSGIVSSPNAMGRREILINRDHQ